MDRPVPNSNGIVADFLLSEKATPYDHTVVNDFIGALTAEEQTCSMTSMQDSNEKKSASDKASRTSASTPSTNPSKKKLSPTYSQQKKSANGAFLYASEEKEDRKTEFFF